MQRAAEAERLGYESAYVTHIAGRDSQVVLAAYATRTEKIKLGTGSCRSTRARRRPARRSQPRSTRWPAAVVLGIGVCTG